MISAESARSRPSPLPGGRDGHSQRRQLRGDGQGARGAEQPRLHRMIADRRKVVGPLAGQGDEGATRVTQDCRRRLIRALARRYHCASQADSASSILVTRSHREGPGQGIDPGRAPLPFGARAVLPAISEPWGCPAARAAWLEWAPACLNQLWPCPPSCISVYSLDSCSV